MPVVFLQDIADADGNIVVGPGGEQYSALQLDEGLTAVAVPDIVLGNGRAVGCYRVSMSAATADAQGAMSAADKAALDALVAASPIAGAATTGAGVAVVDVTDDGGGLVQIEATAHGLNTGDYVVVHGVGGVGAANTFARVTKLNLNIFTLDDSAFSGVYTSGGTVLKCAALFTIPAPADSITEFEMVLHALKSGAGQAMARLRVYVTVGASAIDGSQSGVQFVGTPVDTLLSVFASTIGGAASDGGEIKIATTTHYAWPGDGVEVYTLTAPNAAGPWEVRTVADATHMTLKDSVYDAGYGYTGYVTLLARNKSFEATWAAGVLTVYAVGHATVADLNWNALAYPALTTAAS